jgi:putative copper resistance protein D
MIDVGLILARFLHYAATTALFGASLFPLYAYARAEPEVSRDWRARILLATAILAVVSGLFWFAFSAANMAGSFSDLVDAEVLSTMVRATSFGPVWIARMVLAVVIVVVTAVRVFRLRAFGQDLIDAVLAAVLLASVAGTGHAQVEEGWASVVHLLSDATHLLGVGAWLGGLVPLAYILATHARTNRDTGAIDQVLLRFSGMGYIAVATLVATGLVNSWFLVGSVSSLLGTPYGQVLLAKLVLFSGMLILAVANRFWLVPSISSVTCSGGEPSVWLRRLRKHVLGELMLGAMILSIVSILGTMEPATGQ